MQAAAAPDVYRRLLFPLAARLDAERAHDLSVALLARVSASPALCAALAGVLARPHPALALQRLGLRFRSPLGLAAGFDKNGVAVPALGALGFGHVEVGTVTPLPQPGNLRPRVFRLPADDALINAMGFPSQGAARVGLHLLRWQPRRGEAGLRGVPLALNVGKNKDTPLARAWEDYTGALAALYPYGDYFVANISSPNTVGLRDLHAAEHLAELGAALAERARLLTPPEAAPKPLLLKLSPDLTAAQLDRTLAAALDGPWAGVVLGNTTVSRDGLHDQRRDAPGGVSGRPIYVRTLALARELRRALPRGWVLVAVGGVFGADDAWRLLRAGADLVQVYTGFVYGGPLFATRLNAGLARRLADEGCRSVDEIVGADA